MSTELIQSYEISEENIKSLDLHDAILGMFDDYYAELFVNVSAILVSSNGIYIPPEHIQRYVTTNKYSEVADTELLDMMINTVKNLIYNRPKDSLPLTTSETVNFMNLITGMLNAKHKIVGISKDTTKDTRDATSDKLRAALSKAGIVFREGDTDSESKHN